MSLGVEVPARESLGRIFTGDDVVLTGGIELLHGPSLGLLPSSPMAAKTLSYVALGRILPMVLGTSASLQYVLLSKAHLQTPWFILTGREHCTRNWRYSTPWVV